MADAKPVFSRLWRQRVLATLALPVLIIVALYVVDRAPNHFLPTRLSPEWETFVHDALVVAAALTAIYGINRSKGVMSSALEERLGLGRARSVATFVTVVLLSVVVVLAFNSIGLNLGGLLVGGALTGVILGIAGQASLSNMIGGLVILLVRPYTAGMYMTVRSPATGGVEYSGRVWDISLFYTTLHSAGREVRIPNSAMVAAVVVLRPQELDVYIPITLPPASDVVALNEALSRAVARCTAEKRAPQVELEKITELGYIVGVRVFVANDDERRAVERAIARVVAANPAARPPAASEPAGDRDGATPDEGRPVPPARAMPEPTHKKGGAEGTRLDGRAGEADQSEAQRGV